MATGNAIRGTRVGSGPIRWVEHSEQAPRNAVTYWCVNGHEVTPLFAQEIVPPTEWECPNCGLPAGRDRTNPPPRPQAEPYKTHLAYVKERRSQADGEALLAEALEHLHRRRGGR
ncbi:MAG: RNA polymerase-binding protein RbpA [Dactylosporangium sp.]|nr:RNA polymerase-binding protein RbpA [Dactylosporangium sp.]NNJ60743.1 RNA polymerase-binding protein RbpA [Dactylosporangium sp.]